MGLGPGGGRPHRRARRAPRPPPARGRGGHAAATGPASPAYAEGTGLHSAATGIAVAREARAPRLVVERAPGHTPGMIYDIDDGAVLGRGDAAEIRLEDPFASSRHARILRQAGAVVLEDLGSTNGTYLNEELLHGPAPLHHGDRVRIGDSEFSYEEG